MAAMAEQENPEPILEFVDRAIAERPEEYRAALMVLMGRTLAICKMDDALMKVYGLVISGQMEDARRQVEALYGWYQQFANAAGVTNAPTLAELLALHSTKFFEDRERTALQSLLTEMVVEGLPN